ncbi:TPA: DUF3265 domain-containing protein [Vibrio parahaemolyticus]|nr:DUF3265 domain-containing protein [Vibrio parahaemolyticus]MDG3055332.1 DUF3265 domain-containing protein [Vibrio parahaemolyticus]MDS1925880.1 DUF3265 domain-containing protein [Vibrio parahaemolyticus]
MRKNLSNWFNGTNSYNKQFKRDSARMAFWVCVGFGVEVLCGNIGIACFTP